MRKNRQTYNSNDVSVYLKPVGFPRWRERIAYAALLCVCLTAVTVIKAPVQSASTRAVEVSSRNDSSFAAISETAGTVTPCNAAGGFDTSFGTGGIVTTGVTPNPDIIYAMALQPDGKIVAAGSVILNGGSGAPSQDFALVRYHADGALDQTFGTQGIVTTDIGTGTNDAAFSVALQSDGKIVAAGFTTPGGAANVALVRYNSDGSLDQAFGTSGKKVVDFGSDDTLETVLVQPDGKIVILVERGFGGSDGIGMARYLGDGSPDATFGSGGTVMTNWGGAQSRASSIALQSDGKFILVGSRTSIQSEPVLARYGSDGAIDPAFGTGGLIVADLDGGDMTSVAIQPDGKIVTGGGSDGDFMVARFTPAGLPDPTFGDGGKQVTPISTRNDHLNSLAIQEDGRIVAAGWSENFVTQGFNRDFAAARYNADGSIDTTFNGTGFAKTPISTFDDYAHALVVQPDGRFLVGGASSPAGGHEFAVIRYKGNCEITVEGSLGEALTDGAGAPVDFGEQPVGSPTSPKVFTIRNVGSEPLSIGSITVDGAHGADFSVNTTGTASVVAANASTTFSVTVTPAGPGLRTAALHIESSDQTEPIFDINLIATGISGIMYTLTVATANGSVSSSPAGINCPGDCANDFDEAAPVTLTAQPNLGHRFVGWSGDASGTVNPLSMTMNGNKNITAVFEPPPPTGALFDFDGDRISDLGVQRPSNRMWYLQRTTDLYTGVHLGQSNDRIVPADYDGDGKTDIAIFRGSNGTWHMYMSQTGAFQTFGWGQNGDLPVSSDRDGDGRMDLVLYRPSNSTWYARHMSNGHYTTAQFGIAGDRPLRGDFDGDGRSDLAVFRPSNNTWYIQGTIAGFYVMPWGEAGDKPVPADYDGDRRTDIAVWRPSTGQWFIIGSTLGWMIRTWGEPNDIPTPADFDGDAKTDLSIFRPSSGTWYVIRSTSGNFYVRQFGQSGDVPLPSAFAY